MALGDKYIHKHDHVYSVRNKEAERKEIEELFQRWKEQGNMPEQLPSPGDCFSEASKLSEFNR